MQFHEIHPNALGLTFGGVVLSVFIFFAVMVFAITREKSSKVLVTFSVIFAIGLAITSAIIRDDAITGNRDAFMANIQQKYDVDEVLLEYRGVKTSPILTKDQQVHVSVDGQVYAFDLEQNPETWEPTLLDPAVSGGSVKEKNLSADELLR